MRLWAVEARHRPTLPYQAFLSSSFLANHILYIYYKNFRFSLILFCSTKIGKKIYFLA